MCLHNLPLRFFVLLLLAVTSCHSFQWTSALPDNTVKYACVSDALQFPWNYTTDSGDDILTIQWFREGKSQETLAIFSSGNFLTLPTFTNRLTSINGSQAGIELSAVDLGDKGNYSVKISGHDAAGSFFEHTSTVVVQILENNKLLTTDAHLHAFQRSDPVYNSTSDQWSLVVTCGNFTYPSAPFNMQWMTPDGSLVPSSAYKDGHFELHVTSGGNYTCQIPLGAGAKICLHGNATRHAHVVVDKVETRLTLMEARQGQLLKEVQTLREKESNLTDYVHQLENQLSGGGGVGGVNASGHDAAVSTLTATVQLLQGTLNTTHSNVADLAKSVGRLDLNQSTLRDQVLVLQAQLNTTSARIADTLSNSTNHARSLELQLNHSLSLVEGRLNGSEKLMTSRVETLEDRMNVTLTQLQRNETQALTDMANHVQNLAARLNQSEANLTAATLRLETRMMDNLTRVADDEKKAVTVLSDRVQTLQNQLNNTAARLGNSETDLSHHVFILESRLNDSLTRVENNETNLTSFVHSLESRMEQRVSQLENKSSSRQQGGGLGANVTADLHSLEALLRNSTSRLDEENHRHDLAEANLTRLVLSCEARLAAKELLEAARSSNLTDHVRQVQARLDFSEVKVAGLETNLTNSVHDLAATLDTRNVLANLTDTVHDLQVKLDSQTSGAAGGLSDLTLTMTNVTDHVHDLEARLGSETARSQLALTNLTNSLRDLDTRLSDNETSLSSYVHRLNESTAKSLAGLDQAGQIVRDDLHRLQDLLAKEVTNLTEGIHSVDAKLDYGVGKLDNSVAGLDSKVALLGRNVVSLDNNLTRLDRDVATLDNAVAVMDKNQTRLGNNVAQFNNDVTRLDSQESNLTDSVRSLEQQLDEGLERLSRRDSNLTSFVQHAVVRLQEKAANLSISLQGQSQTHQSTPQRVAFSVGLSANHPAQGDPAYSSARVLFGSKYVNANYGGGLSLTTGYFQAPVPGLYFFTLTAGPSARDHPVTSKVVTMGTVLCTAQALNAMVAEVVSCSAPVHLNRDQLVWVSSGSALLDAVTTFTGFLVGAD